jgi:hypothetical protein
LTREWGKGQGSPKRVSLGKDDLDLIQAGDCLGRARDEGVQNGRRRKAVTRDSREGAKMDSRIHPVEERNAGNTVELMGHGFKVWR